MVAVCEDGSPLAFLLRCAAPPSNSFFLSTETTLSSLERKYAVDKVVSRLILALFRRYQVARLMPNSLHGWVSDRDSDCGRIPAARRLRHLAMRSLCLRCCALRLLGKSQAPMVVIFRIVR